MLIQRAEDDLNELERRAEELRLKAAAIAAEIAQVEQEAKDLRTAIAVWNRYEAPATPQVVSQNTEAGSIKEGSPVERQRETQVSPDNPGSNPFHGKGMAEAAVVALTLRGYPMTYLEITDDLLSGGVQLAAKTPATSVQAALRTAEHKGVLTRFGAHKWALPGWSKAQIDEVVQTEMVKRVKTSLAISKERGVSLGRPSRMTDELKTIILDLAKKGVPHRKIAEQVGFAPTHIGRFLEKAGVHTPKKRSGSTASTSDDLELNSGSAEKPVLN